MPEFFERLIEEFQSFLLPCFASPDLAIYLQTFWNFSSSMGLSQNLFNWMLTVSITSVMAKNTGSILPAAVQQMFFYLHKGQTNHVNGTAIHFTDISRNYYNLNFPQRPHLYLSFYLPAPAMSTNSSPVRVRIRSEDWLEISEHFKPNELWVQGYFTLRTRRDTFPRIHAVLRRQEGVLRRCCLMLSSLKCELTSCGPFPTFGSPDNKPCTVQAILILLRVFLNIRYDLYCPLKNSIIRDPEKWYLQELQNRSATERRRFWAPGKRYTTKIFEGDERI